MTTTKQTGDASEMLVAAELSFAGVPAIKMPDNWPGYDVIAQPLGMPPQRISVKARTFKRGGDTFVDYWAADDFDWLAIVLLPGADELRRRVFIVPKDVADSLTPTRKTKEPNDKYWRVDRVAEALGRFEGNFALSRLGRSDQIMVANVEAQMG